MSGPKRPKCGAPTRNGAPCKRDALQSGTCKMHGGTTTPPVFGAEQKAALIAILEADIERKITLRQAAKQLGYAKRDVQAAIDEDADFRDAYREARGLPDLDEIRLRMAKRAWEDSDRLLALMARMHLPEAQVLNHSKVEMTGADGGPLSISHSFDPAKLSDDELEELKTLLARAKPE